MERKKYVGVVASCIAFAATTLFLRIVTLTALVPTVASSHALLRRGGRGFWWAGSLLSLHRGAWDKIDRDCCSGGTGL